MPTEKLKFYFVRFANEVEIEIEFLWQHFLVKGSIS